MKVVNETNTEDFSHLIDKEIEHLKENAIKNNKRLEYSQEYFDRIEKVVKSNKNIIFLNNEPHLSFVKEDLTPDFLIDFDEKYEKRQNDNLSVEEIKKLNNERSNSVCAVLPLADVPTSDEVELEHLIKQMDVKLEEYTTIHKKISKIVKKLLVNDSKELEQKEPIAKLGIGKTMYLDNGYAITDLPKEKAQVHYEELVDSK